MKHFDISEFDCHSKKGSGKNMDKTFLSMIDDARNIANIPFKITSGWRSVQRNMEVGGVPDSAHLRGLASDINCSDSRSRFTIVSALKEAGFTRIGISRNFIHCDIDTSKSKNCIWVY